MKNYIKNKGFIPDQFITKIQDKNLKNEKKIIFILLCLNLIYLPLNIDLLSKNHNVNVEKTYIKSYSEKVSIDSEKIYGIAEILFSDVVKECDVTNDGGSLIVGSVAVSYTHLDVYKRQVHYMTGMIQIHLSIME